MLRILDYFIKKELTEAPYIQYKSRALVGIHLLAVTCVVLFSVVGTFLDIQINYFVLLSGIFSGFLLLLFKHYANFNLSTNLLCGVFFLIFCIVIPASGGLFSDNCYWLVCIPILALLFSDKKSGNFWLVICLGFICALYFFEIYPKEYLGILLYKPAYYLIGYFFLYIIVYALTYIFKSEQYYVVKSLVEQNELLAQQHIEIEQVNKVMLETQHKLKLTNAELEQFAYVASHDLKEPLRMITMYTQMIKRKLKSNLDTETEEFMFFVTDGTKRMQNLLDDLLDYSRLGKKNNTTVIDLNDVMLVVKQNLKIVIANNEAEINHDTLPKINGIFSEIVQLFQNLINNSIKFKQTDIQPIIKVAIKSIEGDFFTIMIKDNGIGMEQSMTPRIFNLFERLHSRDQYEGTGIGLATCKKVMEHLGGDIYVESELGEGSIFYLKFPNSILSNV
jgi:signal transduction histidine kinase